MSDPVLFVESVKEAGQKHGAVKLIMPESFNSSARTNFQINPDTFQFKTNRILANPKENEILTRLRFYNELINYHLNVLRSSGPELAQQPEVHSSKVEESNIPLASPTADPGVSPATDVPSTQIKEEATKLTSSRSRIPPFLQKLPMMDKRPLDLFDLFRLVIMRGGYTEVINRKLWAQIGRELGYKGKITSSLSSSLKISYAKILHPLEMFLGNRCIEVAGLAEGAIPEVEEPAAKKRKVESLAPLLLGSAKEYRRSIRAKAAKGLLLNQPHLIDIKPPLLFSTAQESAPTSQPTPEGPTKSSKNSTYYSLTPAAQVNNYLKWLSTHAADLQDAARHEPNGKSASIYSLRQFIEKDCKFQEVLISSNPTVFGISSDRSLHTSVNIPSQYSGFQISEESKPVSPEAMEDIFWQRVCREGVDDLLDGLKIENGTSLLGLSNGSGFLRIGDDFSNYKSHLSANSYPSTSTLSSGSDLLTRFPDHMSATSSKSGTPTPADTPLVQSARTSFNGSSEYQSTSSSHSESLILNCHPYISRTIGNSLAPFNIHNIPSLPNSLLAAFSAHDVQNSDIFNSQMSVGMTFSTENWHCEDHFLQRCNYHFFGRSKRWYFIPELDFKKFEELLKDINSLNRFNKVHMNSNVNSWQIPELRKYFKSEDETLNFEFECLFNSLENMINPFPEVRAVMNDPEFQRIIDFNKSKNDGINLNQEFLVSPDMLESRGIRFTTTLQKPGEFIFKFPKTYSSSISLGLNICEEVSLATKSWLDYALEGEQWLKRQGILPGISVFKLLVNLANLYESNFGNFDSETYNKALEWFDKLVERELSLRSQVRSRLKMKEIAIEDRSSNDADCVADDTLENVFPTKIVVTNVKDSKQFSMSLESFLDYFDTLELQKKQQSNIGIQLPDLISSSNHRVELHVFLSDDRLRAQQKILKGYSIEFDDWIANFEKLMKEEEEVPLKTYRILLNDGQKILSALSGAHPKFKRFVANGPKSLEDIDREKKIEYFQGCLENLNQYVTYCNDIIEECQMVLSLKHQQRIRGATENKVPQEQGKQGNLSTLLDLANRILKLNFHAPEFEQIIEFRNEIQNFDRACRNLISKSNVQVAELNDMINLGTSFGIKLPILDFLIRLRDREVWIKTFNTLFEGGDPFAGKKDVYSLSHLEELHSEGMRVLSADDLPKLQQVDAYLREGKQYEIKVKEFLSKNKKLNTVDLNDLEELLVDMEERAKESGERRLFVYIEFYHKLVNLKAQTPLIKLLQNYSTETPSLLSMKQLMGDLEKSDYDFDAGDLKDDLDKSNKWVDDLWAAFKKIQAPFGNRARLECDPQSLKQAVNTDLVKKITLIQNKVSTNLSGNDVDPFERSGGYLFLKDIDAPYDEKQPLRYCICREFEDGIMIECDKCHEWYHIFCVKEKLEIEQNDDTYTCPTCVSLERESILPEFAKERITDKAIDDFVASGEALKVKPVSELKELKKLKEQLDRFKQTFTSEGWQKKQTAILVHFEAFRFRKVFGSPVLITSVYEVLLSFLKDNSVVLFSATVNVSQENGIETQQGDEKMTVEPLSLEIRDTENERGSQTAPYKSANVVHNSPLENDNASPISKEAPTDTTDFRIHGLVLPLQAVEEGSSIQDTMPQTRPPISPSERAALVVPSKVAGAETISQPDKEMANDSVADKSQEQHNTPQFDVPSIVDTKMPDERISQQANPPDEAVEATSTLGKSVVELESSNDDHHRGQPQSQVQLDSASTSDTDIRHPNKAESTITLTKDCLVSEEQDKALAYTDLHQQELGTKAPMERHVEASAVPIKSNTSQIEQNFPELAQHNSRDEHQLETLQTQDGESKLPVKLTSPLDLPDHLHPDISSSRSSERPDDGSSKSLPSVNPPSAAPISNTPSSAPASSNEPGDDTFLASLAADFPNASAYPDTTYVDQSLPMIAGPDSKRDIQSAEGTRENVSSDVLGEILLAEIGDEKNEEDLS